MKAVIMSIAIGGVIEKYKYMPGPSDMLSDDLWYQDFQSANQRPVTFHLLDKKTKEHI